MRYVGQIDVPIDLLERTAYLVRTSAFRMISHTQGGHLGGSSSSVELMVSLYFGGHLRYDVNNPRHLLRDRVLVRGHVGPVRYTIFSLLGWISRDELTKYRQLGSILHGHEAMDVTPGVDITPSGSLGMLLSYGTGCSLAARNRNWPSKSIVFLVQFQARY